MKNAFIIDFEAYRESQPSPFSTEEESISCPSDELCLAIQQLIQKLRQANPFS